MKRAIITSALLPLLTLLFVSVPPPSADSQPFKPAVAPPQDSGTRRVPEQDTDRATKLDSINRKAEILKEKTGEIKQGSVELERATRKLLQEVRKDKEPQQENVSIIKGKDTVVVMEQERVYVRDTSLDHKTWWGRWIATNRRMLKQCKLHGILKKKKS